MTLSITYYQVIPAKVPKTITDLFSLDVGFAVLKPGSSGQTNLFSTREAGEWERLRDQEEECGRGGASARPALPT